MLYICNMKSFKLLPIEDVCKKLRKLNWPAIGSAAFLAAFWVWVIVFAVMLLSGCTTTKYVEVERVSHDTLKITKHQRDSIWLHDSVWVEKDDSIIRIEKWHTKYVEKQVHDTVYQSKTDSIPVPYPVEKLVEKQLSGWQQFRLWLGNIALISGVVAMAAWFVRRKLNP